jgi:hypothetical protein
VDDTATFIGSALKRQGYTDGKNIYNLCGQRVATPAKGLYIINGKKIVMK